MNSETGGCVPESETHKPGEIPKPDLAYKGKFLGYDYKIPQESRETLDKWKAQVVEFRNELKSKSINGLKELTGETDEDLEKKNIKRGRFDWDDVAGILESDDVLDEDTYTLWAIGFWITSNQAEWAGNPAVVKKALKKGPHLMSDVVERKDIASCLDSSVLTKVMAKEFGIDDIEVKK